MRKIISKSYYNFTAQHEAFPYQHEAFLELKDKPFSAIFHEQGLGKTKIAIDLLLYWLHYKDIDTVLVVTKKILIQNWNNELEIHTHLMPKIMTNNKGNNFYVLNSTARIIVTNFETISGEKDRLKLFLQSRNVAIVIDESTKIKNPESKLTLDFFELSPLFKIKLIMTGTPVANRPYDIWSQIFFLDEGKSLGSSFQHFKKSTDLSNELTSSFTKQELFEKSVGSIFGKIKEFSVRETKNSNIVVLPSKVYVNVMLHFEKTQEKMYEQIRNEMEIKLTKGDTTVLDESTITIKRLLRLVQISSNPKLIDDNYTKISAKEVALDELLTDIVRKKEKAIVK